jgi:transcriptional regulator with XRE-family HTH domain
MINGLKIRELREKKNLNIGQLAEALEVSRQIVTSWETNKLVPNKKRLKQISAYFEVDEKCFEPVDEIEKQKETSTIKSLMDHIDALMAEKAQLLNLLDKALSGNFPEDNREVPVRKIWPIVRMAQ